MKTYVDVILEKYSLGSYCYEAGHISLLTFLLVFSDVCEDVWYQGEWALKKEESNKIKFHLKHA